MRNKISLAGDLGSGKSTVLKILAQALGAQTYSTGAKVRAVAEEYGMSIAQLNIYMETHPQIDREIDDGLVRLGEDARPYIIDSRMAWHFTPGTLRVWLSTDAVVSAARIMNDHRAGEHEESLEKTAARTKERRASEKKRYFEKYGVHIMDLSNYDLVVDTTYATPDEVAHAILNAYDEWREGRPFEPVLICPQRLHYPDEGCDGELVMDLSEMLLRGEPVPPVVLSECDGEFYVRAGAASALARALNTDTFVPGTLVPYEEDGTVYVKMENSI